MTCGPNYFGVRGAAGAPLRHPMQSECYVGCLKGLTTFNVDVGESCSRAATHIFGSKISKILNNH